MLDHIPAQIAEWGKALGLFLAGLTAAFGIIWKRNDDRRKEAAALLEQAAFRNKDTLDSLDITERVQQLLRANLEQFAGMSRQIQDLADGQDGLRRELADCKRMHGKAEEDLGRSKRDNATCQQRVSILQAKVDNLTATVAKLQGKSPPS